MGSFKPACCPECGSSSIVKEVIRGYKTGDWSCKSCGDCGPLLDEPFSSKKEENGENKDKE